MTKEIESNHTQLALSTQAVVVKYGDHLLAHWREDTDYKQFTKEVRTYDKATIQANTSHRASVHGLAA